MEFSDPHSSNVIYPLTHENSVKSQADYQKRAKAAFEKGDIDKALDDFVTGSRPPLAQGNDGMKLWKESLAARLESGIALGEKAKSLLASPESLDQRTTLALAEAIGTWNHLVQEKDTRHEREAVNKHFTQANGGSYWSGLDQAKAYVAEVAAMATTLADRVATDKPELAAQIYLDNGPSQTAKLLALAQTQEQNNPDLALKIVDAVQGNYRVENATYSYNSHLDPYRNIAAIDEHLAQAVPNESVYNALIQFRQRLADRFKSQDADLAGALEQQARDMQAVQTDSVALRKRFATEVKPQASGPTAAAALEAWMQEWNERFTDTNKSIVKSDELTLNAAVDHMARYLTRRHNNNLGEVLGEAASRPVKFDDGDELNFSTIGSDNPKVTPEQLETFKKALKRRIKEAAVEHKSSALMLSTGAWAAEDILREAIQEAGISGDFLFPTRTQWYIDSEKHQVMERSTAGGGSQIIYSANGPHEMVNSEVEAKRELLSKQGQRLKTEDIIKIGVKHFCDQNAHDGVVLSDIVSEYAPDGFERKAAALKRELITKPGLTTEFLTPVDEAVKKLIPRLEKTIEAHTQLADASERWRATDTPQALAAKENLIKAKHATNEVGDELADILVKSIEAFAGQAKKGGPAAVQDTFERVTKGYIGLAQDIIEANLASERSQRKLAAYAFTTPQDFAKDKGIELQKGRSRDKPEDS